MSILPVKARLRLRRADSLLKVYCHSGSLRHRAMITTSSPIIAATPNAISHSKLVHLTCFTEEARRPRRRVPASAPQGNLGTDGPTDRTGNRAPRSGDQYPLRSLLECDAHCRP